MIRRYDIISYWFWQCYISVVMMVYVVIAGTGAAAGMKSDRAEADLFLHGEWLWDDGQYEEVLDFWELAYDSLNRAGESDPRIGFRYIERVVGARDTIRYKKASDMHVWALRSGFEDRFIDTIEWEMKRTLPLLDRDTKRQWQKLFGEQDRQLLQEMWIFWERKNAIPSTSINERLIEHWERIHYAREHFTKNKYTVYDTDERALIYVRLGPPDHHQTGIITSNSGAIRNRLYDLLERDIIRGSQMPSLQMNIIQNFSPREYEYWRYDQLSDDGPVFYLFGRPGGSGRFQMLQSLEDFIPAGGYRSVVVGQRGHQSALRAGYFLQFMLYNEMSTVDHYFGSRLMEYEQNWYRALSRNRINGGWLGDMIAPDRAKTDMRGIHDRAPVTVSRFERDVVQYPIFYRDYRFLDEEKGPVSYLLMNPSPRIAIASQMVIPNGHDELPGYLLKQGFNLYRNGERSEHHVKVHYSRERGLDVIDESFFAGELVAGLDENTQVQIFSELYTFPVASRGDIHLAGLSSEWINAARPLEDDGSLMMSDLVLGNTKQIPVSVRSTEMGVLSGNELERDGSLQVYFETYHLSPDPENGSFRYRITYQLKPESRGWFRRRTHDVSMAWESAPGRSSDYQFFEVDLTHTDSGEHTLTITIEDLVSGETYRREVEIMLKE